MVVPTGEKHDRDPAKTLDIRGGSKLFEEWAVGGYKATDAHLHEEMEECHIHTAEKSVYLPVGSFIKIPVVP